MADLMTIVECQIEQVKSNGQFKKPESMLTTRPIASLKILAPGGASLTWKFGGREKLIEIQRILQR